MLDTKSRQALDMLQRVIPYSVTLAGGRQRSVWCTEKAHSMMHWGRINSRDNYHTVGRIRTATMQVTETRMKSAVKTKARKTNNQASSRQWVWEGPAAWMAHPLAIDSDGGILILRQ